MKKQAFKFTLQLTDELVDVEFVDYLNSRSTVLVENVLLLETPWRSHAYMDKDSSNSVKLDVYFEGTREQADKLYAKAEHSLPFIFDNLSTVRLSLSVQAEK